MEERRLLMHSITCFCPIKTGIGALKREEEETKMGKENEKLLGEKKRKEKKRKEKGREEKRREEKRREEKRREKRKEKKYKLFNFIKSFPQMRKKLIFNSLINQKNRITIPKLSFHLKTWVILAHSSDICDLNVEIYG